ncbi:S-layer homology domain-containing protein [Paenibacillus planticolens]|nr:S-layer homology domain-containing protein [Paenibacillus planticolens]
MRKKYKSMSMFMMMICLVSLLPVNSVIFAEDTASFQLKSNKSGMNTGDEFILTVEADNVKDLVGYEVVVSADTDKLSYSSAVSLLSGGQTIVVPRDNTFTIAYSKMGNEMHENGHVPLSSIKFKGIAAGTANVTLQSVKLMDGRMNDSDFSTNQTASVTISSSPGSGGGYVSIPSTTITITELEMKNAINSANEGTATIKTTIAKDANEAIINIPEPIIKMAADNNIQKIEIDAGMATVTLPMDLLKTATSNVQLSLKKEDAGKLSPEVSKVIGNNPVYDIRLGVDGKETSHVNDASVKMSWDYKLDDTNKDAGKVVIYFINENGKLEVVKNSKFNPATGKVSFHTEQTGKYVALYNEVSFQDIANVQWAKASIEALAARGIINGVSEHMFEPNNNVTRAQFIKILMQAFDLDDDHAVSTLTDVKKGEWYYSSIAAAEKLGITQGKDDGSFGINDSITRQDMAVMIDRTIKLLKVKISGNTIAAQFADSSDISEYAADAVIAMQKIGVIEGVGNGNFAPKDHATRAQAAVIIYRVFNLVP